MGEDIIVSFVTRIAEYAVGPILHYARYSCCFNNFAESLSTAKEELELTRDIVKERVREATNRTEKIEPIVENWLYDVVKVLDEVQQLEGRISEVSKSCLRRRCQYFLAKEIARIAEKMTQLNRNSKFDPFSRVTELPGMKFYSSKGFILFKSTETAYNKLLEALKDKSVFRVGLVGLGGSGKTTLAEEVGKKAEEFKLFQKVVMATISQPPNIRRIQSQIANQLGVKLEEESSEGRAQRLSKRLSEGTTLLILDDVWEWLDLEALGIPFHVNKKSCIVLLTSRKRDVCNSMQCESIVDLNLLTGEEAWSLFSLYANINDIIPNALKIVARKIVNECKGLPIAIVIVGSTLRGRIEKSVLVLSRLEDSRPLEIPKGLTSSLVCLRQIFYNFTLVAQSLLWFCSIFPEDREINLEDLFRFGKSCLIFGTMEEGRRDMHVAVNILRDYCLLLDAKNKKVKMHDIVRDLALRIEPGRDQEILTRTAMDPRMLADDETIKYKRAISLWDLQDGQLPVDQLNCPSLEILLLHSEEVGFEVSNACLESLVMLEVLAFITCDYSWQMSWPVTSGPSLHNLSLPQSIALLRNLHTLCLRGYKLGDISILERLKALEILDLRGSSFEELPNGIVALERLELLDLYDCWIEKNNAVEVIGKCWRLEELYLCLFQSTEDFPHNVYFPRLQRYVIIQLHFESNWDYREVVDVLEKHRPSRALCLEGFNVSAESFMSLPVKNLFLKVEYLHLKRLEGGYKM